MPEIRTTDWVDPNKTSQNWEVPTWCVPSASWCAMVVSRALKVPVRIAVQKIDPVQNKDHSQAEAFIDGKWVPLSEFWNGQSMVCRPWKRHFPEAGEPYRYLTLPDWLEEQYINPYEEVPADGSR